MSQPSSAQTTSSLSANDFVIPPSPPLADSCPISSLLGKRVTEMTDEELDKYVTEMRTLAESPQTLRMKLGKGTKSKKPAKPLMSVEQLMAL